MYTDDERAEWRRMFKLWKETGESPWSAGIRKEQPDVTTVQRQEQILKIKRDFVAEAQAKHATEAVGPDTRSSYQLKQFLAAKQYANRQYQKAKDDAKRAEGLELMMKTVSPSTYVEAATGLDLGTAGRLITDAAAFGLPGAIKSIAGPTMQYGRNFLLSQTMRQSLNKNPIKGLFYTLRTPSLDFESQDITSGIFDEYAKQWFNNEVSSIRPFRSSGRGGDTVGDVIDYNLGLWGGREKPLSELTENLRYRLATILAKDERFPKGTRVIHMDDSGPLPVNKAGFVPKDASNSKSVWNNSLQGLPEIWWNRGTPYYDARGYRSVQDIPRTIVSDIEDLKQHGVVLDGSNVMHGPGIVPFQAVHYGIQPNPFGWFDRIKFVGQ